LSGRRWIDDLLRGAVDSPRPTLDEGVAIGLALVALNEHERAIELPERVRPLNWRLWFWLLYPELTHCGPILAFSAWSRSRGRGTRRRSSATVQHGSPLGSAPRPEPHRAELGEPGQRRLELVRP